MALAIRPLSRGGSASSATPASFPTDENPAMHPITALAVPHRARRPSRGFAGFALALGLGLGLLCHGDAHAQAVLLMPDVCDDPAATFDARWAQARPANPATTTYLMQSNGTVQWVAGPEPGFETFAHLYIAAHGNLTMIDGMTHGDFATRLLAAHPVTPQTVTFAVCKAAAGPDSLVKQVNDKYAGGIARLEGGVDNCRLVGNGDQNLANAQYRINAGSADAALGGTIQDNIMDRWGLAYPGSAANYSDFCEAIIDVTTPFDAAQMRGFLATVYTQFTQVAAVPIDSSNYLELVALNTGGDPLLACGADPAGDGVAVACP